MCGTKRNPILGFIFAFLFLVFLVAAIYGPIFLAQYLNSQIKQQVIVDSFDSPGFWDWQNNTAPKSPPVWMKFNIFNVTNPNKVLLGAIPDLQEVGPYSYREYNVYFNITFMDNGNLRSMRKWQYFVYDPATSFAGANPINDTVTVLNLPFQAVLGNLLQATTGGDWWETLAFDTLASMTGSEFFVTVKVNDLIWGYEDPLLAVVSSLQPGVSPIIQLQPNQTQDQTYETQPLSVVQTGKDDINNIGNIIVWQGQNSLTCWATQDANRIGGNFDNNFPPGVTKDEPLFLWVDQLFRKGYFSFDKEVELFGINLYSYLIPKTELDNADDYPQNDAFYQYGPSGVANLTSPTGGVPMFISKPHFLDADPYYLKYVNMAPPDHSLHDTTIQVEPITGIMMNGCKRLQVNIKVQRDALLYPRVNTSVYFPIAWVEESGGVTSDLADQFKGSVYLALKFSTGLRWGGVGAGAVCLILAIVFIVLWRKQDKKKHPYTLIQ